MAETPAALAELCWGFGPPRLSTRGLMGELHNLMGLVAALLICGAPHAVRLIRAAEPSDATIGYWLQRAYFVLQACDPPPA